MSEGEMTNHVAKIVITIPLSIILIQFFIIFIPYSSQASFNANKITLITKKHKLIKKLLHKAMDDLKNNKTFFSFQKTSSKITNKLIVNVIIILLKRLELIFIIQ